MDTGLHVIEHARWRGRDPADGYGVLDFCRVVSGHGGEPAGDRPILVTGLTRLLESAEAVDTSLRPIRHALHRGKPYFEWRELPVVLLVRGELAGPRDGGPHLQRGDRTWSLTPLVGGGLRPRHEGEMDWWYSPQFD